MEDEKRIYENYRKKTFNQQINNILFLRFISDLKFKSISEPYQLERLKSDLSADIQQGIPLNVIVRRSPGSFFELDNSVYIQYTTPLIIAIQRNSPELVQFLIKKGADPNFGLDGSDRYVMDNDLFGDTNFTDPQYVVNANGIPAVTPLDFSVYLDLPLVARTLIENGADRLTLSNTNPELNNEQREMIEEINEYIAYLRYRPGSQLYNQALYRFGLNNITNPRQNLRKLPAVNPYTPGKSFGNFVKF